jgi:hypothetical protein
MAFCTTPSEKNVEVVDPIAESNWNAALSEYDAATIFHTVNWAAVLANVYKYRICHIVLRKPDRMGALLPIAEVSSFITGRRGVSLPFADECSPLLCPQVSLEEVLDSALPHACARRWRYLELRTNAEGVPGAVASTDYRTHSLSLEPTDDAQFAKLRSSQQRNIRKAVREGVEIHRLQTHNAVDEYYLLHCLTRKRQGVPPQPRRFFQAIHQFIIERGNGFVLLARYKGQWVAGGVFLHFGQNAVYKFGASNLGFQHVRPNSLLMWEAIRYYRAAGMKQFSFGRTDPNHAGLLQFKRSWGAEEAPLRYYRVGIGKPVRLRLDRSEGKGIASKIIRHMPVPMLRLVGELAYRHLG